MALGNESRGNRGVFTGGIGRAGRTTAADHDGHRNKSPHANTNTGGYSYRRIYIHRNAHVHSDAVSNGHHDQYPNNDAFADQDTDGYTHQHSDKRPG